MPSLHSSHYLHKHTKAFISAHFSSCLGLTVLSLSFRVFVFDPTSMPTLHTCEETRKGPILFGVTGHVRNGITRLGETLPWEGDPSKPHCAGNGLPPRTLSQTAWVRLRKTDGWQESGEILLGTGTCSANNWGMEFFKGRRRFVQWNLERGKALGERWKFEDKRSNLKQWGNPNRIRGTSFF